MHAYVHMYVYICIYIYIKRYRYISINIILIALYNHTHALIDTHRVHMHGAAPWRSPTGVNLLGGEIRHFSTLMKIAI